MRRGFDEGEEFGFVLNTQRRNIHDIWNRGNDVLLRLRHWRFNRRYFPVGGGLAAGTPGTYHYLPTVHGHVIGAFCFSGCGNKAWQEAAENWPNRPEQHRSNREGNANSIHPNQTMLLGDSLQWRWSTGHRRLNQHTDSAEAVAVIAITSRSSVSHLGAFVMGSGYFKGEVAGRRFFLAALAGI